MREAYGHYINGRWVRPKGAKSFETANPATGEVLARFPQGTADDVAAAVKAAKAAFPKWSRMPPPRRGDLLLDASRIFRRRKEELGAVVTQEMGKVLAEGKGDVQEAVDFYQYVAGEGRRFFGETTTSELPDKMAMTLHLPLGPVGLITPWNFPVAIPSWKSGGVLMAGCTVVFKPSSLTPLCGAKVCEVLEEAGLPRGVFNMVTGGGGVVGSVGGGVTAVGGVGGVTGGLGGATMARARSSFSFATSRSQCATIPSVLPSAQIPMFS